MKGQTKRMKAEVIGAGLAGCEAAFQMAQRGISVTLYEMKPESYSPAHRLPYFAELVCSNSLRSDSLTNAVGLLKEEMRRLNSIIISCADLERVEAGGALAVDRIGFSKLVTDKLSKHPNINIISKRIDKIPQGECVIIATGPLTDGGMAEDIEEHVGKGLYFYDAAAPIVTFDSIDMDNAYFAARYNKGTPDYFNCPMTKDEFAAFYNELVNAECAKLKEFDSVALKVFEGCMPVEEIARRGEKTLVFGPLKPVGLINPKTGEQPYAVVQLRRDNSAGTLYNLVGFQTHLKFSEQKRVFSMIPALKNAEFVRYGVMHRNTYINSPGNLKNTFESRKRKGLFFAGQITGVEGYVESAASGLTAGINASMMLLNRESVIFPATTALGALSNYISDERVVNFQPMNINFGLFPPLEEKIINKKEKYLRYAKRALEDIESIKTDISA